MPATPQVQPSHFAQLVKQICTANDAEYAQPTVFAEAIDEIADNFHALEASYADEDSAAVALENLAALVAACGRCVPVLAADVSMKEMEALLEATKPL